MELAAPAPTLAARGIQFCNTSSAAQTVTIDGLPRTADGSSCDYHFNYDYEVPTGWSVSTTARDNDTSPRRVSYQSRTVTVRPTGTATNGTMTVRTRHPNFTVQTTSRVGLKIGGFATNDFGLTGPSTGSGSASVTVRARALPGVSTTISATTPGAANSTSVANPDAGLAGTFSSALSAPSSVETYQVKLLDSRAEVRYEGQAQHGKLRIDTRNLSSGTYYLHIQRAGQPTAKMPLIIE